MKNRNPFHSSYSPVLKKTSLYYMLLDHFLCLCKHVHACLYFKICRIILCILSFILEIILDNGRSFFNSFITLHFKDKV